MNADDILNRPLSEKQKTRLGEIARKQAADDDSDIDYSDIPELTDKELANLRPWHEVFPDVPLRDARPKVAVSVRLEQRVIDWLKRQGPGHLTRINDILVERMTGHTPQYAIKKRPKFKTAEKTKTRSKRDERRGKTGDISRRSGRR